MKVFLYLAVVLVLLSCVPCAIAQGTHTVTISFTASVDVVDGYNMYRAPGVCGGASQVFVKLNASPFTTLSYADTGIDDGSYCYEATATRNSVESNPSVPLTVLVRPAAPSSLAAKVT